MSLRYCTVDTLEELRRTVPERLDWYYAPNSSVPPSYLGGFRETSIQAPELASRLTVNEQLPFKTDAANALVVYKSLRTLTPHQASIERMWAYLCHFDCPRYVSARWLYRRSDNDELAAREVRNHFFATDNRGVIRDNGISRLWWLGRIAHDVDPDSPGRFLALLLHRQDVRSALIERPYRIDESTTSPLNLSGNAGALGRWWRVVQTRRFSKLDDFSESERWSNTVGRTVHGRP